MDEQLGRLVAGVRAARAGPAARSSSWAITARGSATTASRSTATCCISRRCTCRCVVAGPASTPARRRRAGQHAPRVPHRRCDWAGLEAPTSLRGAAPEVVLGEAMKPFLEYGWQPQVMAVAGRHKAIFAGRFELYDVAADPAERRDLARSADAAGARCARRSTTTRCRRRIRRARRDALDAGREAEARQPRLRQRRRRAGGPEGRAASRRHDAAVRSRWSRPRPLRARRRTRRSIPLLERILAEDPTTSTRRCAWRRRTRRSGTTRRPCRRSSGRRRSRRSSPDVRLYLALHYARGRSGRAPCRCSSRSSAESPDRLPALEALAAIRASRDGSRDAIALLQKVYALRAPAPSELVQLGQLAMGERRHAHWRLQSFEAARAGRAARSPRSRAGRPLSGRAPLRGRARRARSRPAVASRVPDGALQARAGQRAAERARPRRADRARASAGRRDDAGADRRARSCSKASEVSAESMNRDRRSVPVPSAESRAARRV